MEKNFDWNTMTSVYCHNCGETNEPGTKICKKCGYKLLTVAEATQLANEIARLTSNEDAYKNKESLSNLIKEIKDLLKKYNITPTQGPYLDMIKGLEQQLKNMETMEKSFDVNTMTSEYCHNCGETNEPGTKICKKCGYKLLTVAEATQLANEIARLTSNMDAYKNKESLNNLIKEIKDLLKKYNITPTQGPYLDMIKRLEEKFKVIEEFEEMEAEAEKVESEKKKEEPVTAESSEKGCSHGLLYYLLYYLLPWPIGIYLVSFALKKFELTIYLSLYSIIVASIMIHPIRNLIFKILKLKIPKESFKYLFWTSLITWGILFIFLNENWGKIKINSPQNFFETLDEMVKIEGVVTKPSMKVLINNNEPVIDKKEGKEYSFQQDIKLNYGKNVINIQGKEKSYVTNIYLTVYKLSTNELNQRLSLKSIISNGINEFKKNKYDEALNKFIEITNFAGTNEYLSDLLNTGKEYIIRIFLTNGTKRLKEGKTGDAEEMFETALDLSSDNKNFYNYSEKAKEHLIKIYFDDGIKYYKKDSYRSAASKFRKVIELCSTNKEFSDYLKKAKKYYEDANERIYVKLSDKFIIDRDAYNKLTKLPGSMREEVLGTVIYDINNNWGLETENISHIRIEEIEVMEEIKGVIINYYFSGRNAYGVSYKDQYGKAYYSAY